MQAFGVDEDTPKTLLADIPQTLAVTPEQGESYWANVR